MKHVKQSTALWLCLVIIVSMAAIACFGCQGQSETEFIVSYLDRIESTRPDEAYITSFQVLEEEGKILLEIDKSTDVPIEAEGELVGFEVKTSLYEWDMESHTMRQIDLGGITPGSVAWNGRTVVFTDETDHTLLYQGTVEDGQLKDVRPVKMDTTIWQCYDLSDDTLLFVSDFGELTLGTLENGALTNTRPLTDVEANGYGTAVLVGEDPSVFVEALLFDGENIEISHKILGTTCVDAKVDSLIETDAYFGYLPHISVNVGADKFYYMGKDFSVYEAPLSAFLREAARIVPEIGEDYSQGAYTCDLYDTGSFPMEYRSKTGEEGKSGVYYEIFVRAFADSDGDGIGDFNGITENLDYLQELGIDGIWLMPINASPSYHGYDVTDYLSLNSDYGTEEDFQRLLEEAHKRGIRVIMDFVINHTSSEHPWFQAALADENSPYRDYYRWVYEKDAADFSTADRSDWNSRVWHRNGEFYYYGMFSADMPDLNYNNPEVREAIKAAAGKWLEMGVDGFRLDAAMHIYGANEFKQENDPAGSTLAWWNEFARYCESINPEVYLVGEAWRGDDVLAEYAQPFDTKFNFAFQEKLLACVSAETALSAGQPLSACLEAILNAYDAVDTNYLDGVFGSNHDQERILSAVGSIHKAKQVAAVYLTLPGNPFLYYGEELGMLGEKPDEMIRTPFLWGGESAYDTAWIDDPQNAATPMLDAQKNDPDSMYAFYRRLIALRKANPALTQGGYEAVDLGNDSIMAYIREADGQKLLVIHNFSPDAQTLRLSGYGVEAVLFSTEEVTADLTENAQLQAYESLILSIA